MKRPRLHTILICTIAAGALALRLPRLGLRPMHTDEAVQAVKSGELLTTGRYVYDPDEYHGPTLQFLSLPFMWASAGTDWKETTETTYRLVPVFVGVALVLLLLLVADGIGKQAAVASAALVALSPAMAYYSRYYIHEMLLVMFTFLAIAAGWKYARTRSVRWAVATGAFVGCMHATKETCVVAFAAMAMGIAGLIAWRKWVERDAIAMKPYMDDRRKILYALAAAFGVSFILFSSFLTNIRGPLDSVLTYASYISRGTGGSLHTHPWYYYIEMLVFTKYGRAPMWSEALILVLFLAGSACALARKGVADEDVSFLRFMVLYTFFMALIYALIPYKTPWCMINFLHGMIVVAGFGAVAVVRLVPNRYAKVGLAAAMGLFALQLGAQALRTNFRFCADRRNPYVYAHTSTDFLNLVERLEEIAEVAPQGRDTLVRVIADDPWPLPWYLRKFGRVGYWQTPPDDCDAPLVVASTENAPAVGKRMEDEYQTQYFGHRPEVHLLLYVRKDLWGRFMDGREGVRAR